MTRRLDEEFRQRVLFAQDRHVVFLQRGLDGRAEIGVVRGELLDGAEDLLRVARNGVLAGAELLIPAFAGGVARTEGRRQLHDVAHEQAHLLADELAGVAVELDAVFVERLHEAAVLDLDLDRDAEAAQGRGHG